MDFARPRATRLIAHLHVKKWFRDEATASSTNATALKKQRLANARTTIMNLAMLCAKICLQVLLDFVWMISVTVLPEQQLLPRFFSNALSHTIHEHGVVHIPSSSPTTATIRTTCTL
ncbi:unnamed protein product [Mucor fragilis]